MASNTVVTSRVSLDRGALSILDAALSVALEQTGDAILTDIKDSGLIPFDTGEMQNSDTFVKAGDGKVSIITSAPQARRLYYHPEYNFRKTNNVRAGGKWFERYMSENPDRIPEIYANRCRTIGGFR